MAIDLIGKVYTPGQITQSVWDIDENALRVTGTVSIDSTGLATEDKQDDQITILDQIAANTGGSSGLGAVGTPVYYDYSGVPVDSSAYVQIIADSGADVVSQVNIFDSSGQSLYLAFGAAASEVNQMIIAPGGQGQLPLQIPANTRVSIKAVNTTASAGVLVLNMFG